MEDENSSSGMAGAALSIAMILFVFFILVSIAVGCRLDAVERDLDRIHLEATIEAER